MNKAADNLRILEAAMVEAAKSGHPGGSMSGTDFLNVLYSNFLVYDPEDPDWFARDRFFLDPGHMSPMLYSVLAMCGKYSIDDLKQFRQWQSATPGHPELDVKRGIENSSGPLGQGHVMAVGAAIAERCIAAHFGEIVSHKTYALISDGGIQEEISQGAGRIAGLLGLSNLIMFFDSNKVQLATMVDVVTNEDTAAKYRAWNWNVIEIDGNDPLEIAGALENAIKETKRPTLIIGNTIMGKGCVTADGKNFEFKCSTHGNPISKSGASYEKTVENLGGDPNDPWVVFEETKRLYAERKEELKKIVAKRKAEFAEWKEAAGEPNFTRDNICSFANVYDISSNSVNRFGNAYFECDDKFPNTAPVGSFSANSKGYYDLFGNVKEWLCNSESDRTNTCANLLGAASLAVAGGGFSDGPKEMRKVVKDERTSLRYAGLGFRLAVDASSINPNAVSESINKPNVLAPVTTVPVAPVEENTITTPPASALDNQRNDVTNNPEQNQDEPLPERKFKFLPFLRD